MFGIDPIFLGAVVAMLIVAYLFRNR